jgi:hypothetical protein
MRKSTVITIVSLNQYPRLKNLNHEAPNGANTTSASMIHTGKPGKVTRSPTC